MISLSLEEKAFPGGAPLLRDIDLQLDSDDFLAILGPSGIGKTTLLRMLAGLDTDFRGTRTGGDADFRVGYLFQEPRLMPWLSVEANVELVSRSPGDGTARALEAVQMSDSADLYPHQLSGGMQRRVALARAIASEPQLLILDEPFVSLDQPAAEELHELLISYRAREQVAVVLVSHNLEEAIALADRLIFIGGAPAGVIHAADVDIPRPRGLSSPAVQTFREQLLAGHPGLLSGSLGDSR